MTIQDIENKKVAIELGDENGAQEFLKWLQKQNHSIKESSIEFVDKYISVFTIEIKDGEIFTAEPGRHAALGYFVIPVSALDSPLEIMAGRPQGESIYFQSAHSGITVRCDKSYDRFRVFLNDVLHLSIEYKGISIQSWKIDDAKYCIEYRGLNGVKTLCEYDKKHVWEAILKNIVELKVG